MMAAHCITLLQVKSELARLHMIRRQRYALPTCFALSYPARGV